MAVRNVSTYTSWKCPYCYWEVRFWSGDAPRNWFDVDDPTRTGIVKHIITHPRQRPSVWWDQPLKMNLWVR